MGANRRHGHRQPANRHGKHRMRIELNEQLIAAAGMDAGNASMRKAGRPHWNEDDYNAACRAAAPLWGLLDRKRAVSVGT